MGNIQVIACGRALYLGLALCWFQLPEAVAQEAPLLVQRVGSSMIRHLSDLAQAEIRPDRVASANAVLLRLKSAVQEHPDLLAAQSRLGLSERALDEARAAWLPKLQFTTAAGERKEFGQSYSKPRLTLGASQLVYDFGASNYRIDAASGSLTAAQSAWQATVTATLQRALSAWHELYRARQHLALQQHNVEARREIVELVKERAELGGSSMSDVLRARAREAEAAAQLANARARVQMAEAAWREFVPEGPPAPLDIMPFEPLDQTGLREGIDQLAQAYPSVREKLALSDSLQQEALAVHRSTLPRLSLEWARSRHVQADVADNQSVQLLLTHNLYTGGADSARHAQALARAEQARAAAANELLQVRKTLLQISAEVESAPDTLAARRLSLGVAADTLEAVREQFAYRRGTLLDLLRAQEDLYESGRSLVDALADTAMARYRLQLMASMPV